MSPEEFRELARAKGFVECRDGSFTHPSKTVPHAGDTGQASKLERHSRHGAVGAVPVQGKIGRKFFVRVTSFRTRLLDEDNQCEKYHVDLCRYAGIIPSDAPGTTKIEVRQEKVGKGEPEFVRIEVFETSPTVLT